MKWFEFIYFGTRVIIIHIVLMLKTITLLRACSLKYIFSIYLIYNATMIVVSNVSSKRIINFPFLLRLFRVNRSLRNNIYLSNLTNIFNSIIRSIIRLIMNCVLES